MHRFPLGLSVLLLWMSFLTVPATAQEATFGSDLERVNCPIFSGLTKEGYEKVLGMRAKATTYCVACSGDQCAMKIWSAERKNEALLCQRLFCTPIKPVADIFHDEDHEGNSKRTPFAATFHYKINKEGRGELVSLKKQKGRQSESELFEFVNKGLSRLEFEPLVIDGQAREILNLRGKLRRGRSSVKFL